ncbi:uncharacterized protein LOC135469078 [Liolophura sinensis]|uniref:uncharacterized protein LOC135469078 n=1 Tax=Liolophura sinensis TaxID=3198878 RepID=UPI0031580684
MACEENCDNTTRRPVWQELCQEKQTCVSSCIDKQLKILDMEYVPPIPTLHPPITHDNQTIVHWDRSSTTDNQTVIYIIQHQLNADPEWLFLGWVENTNRYMFTEDGMDYCENHRFRVAAVNQYGTAGFSSPQSSLPKPKLLFEQKQFTYDRMKQEFFIKVICDIPFDWLHSGAKCEWRVPSFTGHCPFMPAIQPIVRAIKHRRRQWFEVSVADAGFGCNYTGKVRLVSRCKARSKWVDVHLSLSECSLINKFPCPHKEVPPGQVKVVEVFQDTRGVYIKWEPPEDQGSRGIGAYGIQWGFCHSVVPGAGLKLYKLEHEKVTVVGKPDLTLNVSHPTQLYGVRIAALSPGQLTSTVNFNVISTHCAKRIGSHSHGHGHGKGEVLLKKNDVKVMHYPHDLKVLISWHTPPYRDKKKDAVKQYALRWGPLIDHQGGNIDDMISNLNDTVMQVENSTLVPGRNHS